MLYSYVKYPETNLNYFTCYRCEDRPVFKASYLLRSHCMRIHNQHSDKEYRSLPQCLSYKNIRDERFWVERATLRERLDQHNLHPEKQKEAEHQSQATLEENIDIISLQHHLLKQQRHIRDILEHHNWLAKVLLKFVSESDSPTKQRLQNPLQSKTTLENEVKEAYTEVEILKNVYDKLQSKPPEQTNTADEKNQHELTLEVHQLFPTEENHNQPSLKIVKPIMNNSESQTEENNPNSELLKRIYNLEVKLTAKTIIIKEHIKERASAETTIFFLKEDLTKKESQLSETRLKVKNVEGKKDELEATVFELEQKCLKSQSKLNLVYKEITALKGSADLNNLKEAQDHLQKARNVCKILRKTSMYLSRKKKKVRTKL